MATDSLLALLGFRRPVAEAASAGEQEQAATCELDRERLGLIYHGRIPVVPKAVPPVLVPHMAEADLSATGVQ